MVHLPGKGTGARRVPLILTSDVLPAMKALVKHREHCGVLNSNVYFFAMPSSHGYVNGWQVMDRVAMDASLSKPKLIHSTQLRKYAATVTQVLSKSGTGKVEKRHRYKQDTSHLGKEKYLCQLSQCCTNLKLRKGVGIILLLQKKNNEDHTYCE